MATQSDHQRVLQVFANYGLKKTSMTDLADAAQISRQTLYNRFSSKESVLDWAVAHCVDSLLEKATAELLPATPPRDRLLAAFERWLGDMVPIVRNSPHGAEVMDLGMASLQRQGIEPHNEFELALAGFLIETDLVTAPSRAADTTFLLSAAAKGLLLKSSTSEEFSAGMQRIIRAVFPPAA